jgi:1D-myo-inositol-tetrakisphosphate 5-kinase/inositol-polyphosphate multikinase
MNTSYECFFLPMKDQHYDDQIKQCILENAFQRGSRHRTSTAKIENESYIMEHQVGGKSQDKMPILAYRPNDWILKPLHCKYRGFREIAFYETIRQALECNDTCSDIRSTSTYSSCHDYDLLKELASFTVPYHGVVITNSQISTTHELISELTFLPSNTHLILSDMTTGFYRPNIMDLKIGRKTYEPDATLEKIQSQTQKYPQQEQFGFRIVGVRMYKFLDDMSDGEYQTLDKNICRSFKESDDILCVFHSFFDPRNTYHPMKRVERVLLIQSIICKLQELYKWFQKNKRYAFYASSILLVVEGDIHKSQRDSFDLKMIDFAHVRHHAGGDHDYIHGLVTISSILERLLSVIDM